MISSPFPVSWPPVRKNTGHSPDSTHSLLLTLHLLSLPHPEINFLVALEEVSPPLQGLHLQSTKSTSYLNTGDSSFLGNGTIFPLPSKSPYSKFPVSPEASPLFQEGRQALSPRHQRLFFSVKKTKASHKHLSYFLPFPSITEGLPCLFKLSSAYCLWKMKFSYLLLTSFSTCPKIGQMYIQGKRNLASLWLLARNRAFIYLKNLGNGNAREWEAMSQLGCSGFRSLQGPGDRDIGWPKATSTGDQITHRTEIKTGPRLKAQN